MSATTVAEDATLAPASAAPPAAEPTESPRRGLWWRRLRLWLVVAVVVALAAALLTMYQSKEQRGSLDPDAATPDGSRAAATLLRNHGVRVDERHDVETTLDTASGGDVTLLVTTPGLLNKTSLEALTRMPKSVRVVLVEPDDLTLADLDLGIKIQPGADVGLVRQPECELPEAKSAGPAEVGFHRYQAPARATSCYDRSLIVASREGGEVVLLGGADPLTNDRLDEQGNAALTLGLLSAHRRLLWLIPSEPQANAAGRDLSAEDLLPPWVPWLELLLLAAAVLAILWRSRRLGPPVAEPLPVVVRSAETVEGRARLYRRARARAEAYEALRAGALAKVLPALGLGREPDYRALLEAIAERTGRPMAGIQAVLYGPPPADDAALVVAADGLDSLVRDILDPAGTDPTHQRPNGEGLPE